MVSIDRPLKKLHFRQFICIKKSAKRQCFADFLIKVVCVFLAKYKMQLNTCRYVNKEKYSYYYPGFVGPRNVAPPPPSRRKSTKIERKIHPLSSFLQRWGTWFNQVTWRIVLPLKNVHCYLKGKGLLTKILKSAEMLSSQRLSIDTTHTVPLKKK